MLKIMLVLMVLVLASLVYKLFMGSSLRRTAAYGAGSLVCAVIGHRRSERRIRKVLNTYYSRCHFCDVPLEKHGRDGDWQLSARDSALVVGDAAPRRADADDVSAKRSDS